MSVWLHVYRHPTAPREGPPACPEKSPHCSERHRTARKALLSSGFRVFVVFSSAHASHRTSHLRQPPSSPGSQTLASGDGGRRACARAEGAGPGRAAGGAVCLRCVSIGEGKDKYEGRREEGSKGQVRHGERHKRGDGTPRSVTAMMGDVAHARILRPRERQEDEDSAKRHCIASLPLTDERKIKGTHAEPPPLVSRPTPPPVCAYAPATHGRRGAAECDGEGLCEGVDGGQRVPGERDAEPRERFCSFDGAAGCFSTTGIDTATAFWAPMRRRRTAQTTSSVASSVSARGTHWEKTRQNEAASKGCPWQSTGRRRVQPAGKATQKWKRERRGVEAAHTDSEWPTLRRLRSFSPTSSPSSGGWFDDDASIDGKAVVTSRAANRHRPLRAARSGAKYAGREVRVSGLGRRAEDGDGDGDDDGDEGRYSRSWSCRLSVSTSASLVLVVVPGLTRNGRARGAHGRGSGGVWGGLRVLGKSRCICYAHERQHNDKNIREEENTKEDDKKDEGKERGEEQERNENKKDKVDTGTLLTSVVGPELQGGSQREGATNTSSAQGTRRARGVHDEGECVPEGARWQSETRLIAYHIPRGIPDSRGTIYSLNIGATQLPP
ncbi:hypothetical protein C8R45DRAFT_1082528 [Mycena sanguinolenta]|nr:hypothetical protein C8R45DRAFT_1082528 [Mycena sanguinolenta]